MLQTAKDSQPTAPKNRTSAVAVAVLAATLLCSLLYGQSNLEYFGLTGFGLIALIILALWGGHPWRGGKYCIPFILVAAFWLWWWLSSFWSPVHYISTAAAWKTAALPAATMTGLLFATRTRFLKQGILVVSLGVLALAVYACIQFFIYGERPTATFINRNNFAALQLPIAILSASVALNSRLGHYRGVAALLATALLIFVMGLIGSRGALIALLTGLSLILLMAWREKVPRKTLLIVVTTVLAALVASTLVGLGELSQRVSSLSDPQSAGQSRFLIWEGALDMLAQAPWYGIGPGLFYLVYPQYRLDEDTSSAFYAHNDYLQFLIEAGWPALLLVTMALLSVAWLVGHSLMAGRGNSKQRLQITALFAGLSAVAAHSLLTFNLYLMPILIVMGLLLAQLLELLRLNFQKQDTNPQHSESSSLAVRRKLPRIALTLALMVPATFFGKMIAGNSFFNEAIAEIQSGNIVEGETYLKQAISWWPSVDLYHYTLAWQLLQRAQSATDANPESLLAMAHARLDRAQQLNPYRPQPLIIRGLIHKNTLSTGAPRNKGALEAAEQAFRHALEIDPFSLQARYQLARLLLGSNRIEEGFEVLEDGVDKPHETNSLSVNYLFLTAEMRRILGDEQGHKELMKTVTAMRAQLEKQQTPAFLKTPTSGPL